MVGDRKLKAQEFVFACEEAAMRGLPADLPRPQRKVMWTTLQLHFGDPNVHFELQPRVSHGMIELGLHFEGPLEANDIWAERLASRAASLAPELGPEWELEAWTASWRRLHRIWRTSNLTEGLAREVGEELGRVMRVLGPVIAGDRK